MATKNGQGQAIKKIQGLVDPGHKTIVPIKGDLVPKHGHIKASVVIPAFMEEKNIASTLQSLSGQKVSFNFEVIVSDASSTDKTVKIAKSRGAKVLISPKTTIGVGRAIGLLAAKGEILVFTSADTVFEQGWLQNIVAPFENPGVAAVLGRFRPKEGTVFENFFCDCLLFPAAKLLAYLHMYYANGDAMAIRKSVYTYIGGINRELVTAEDTDIAMRASRIGRVVFCDSARAIISMRRIRKWGYPRFILFHTANFFMTTLFNKPFGKYEAIRD
ncbi:glycosyltransferase [Candidatus Parvarchaeota archaeon]|nr:glycosyltransferase [Candidatus Parvarchaeota archaeon]